MKFVPFHVLAGTLAIVAGFIALLYWLWRYRRKRSSRDVAGVSAPEAI